MTFQSVLSLARLRIPNVHYFVLASGGDGASVAADGNALNQHVQRALERQLFFAGLRIPQTHCRIPTAGHQGCAVAAEIDAVYFVPVTGQSVYELAGGEIPDLCHTVFAGRRD